MASEWALENTNSAVGLALLRLTSVRNGCVSQTDHCSIQMVRSPARCPSARDIMLQMLTWSSFGALQTSCMCPCVYVTGVLQAESQCYLLSVGCQGCDCGRVHHGGPVMGSVSWGKSVELGHRLKRPCVCGI